MPETHWKFLSKNSWNYFLDPVVSVIYLSWDLCSAFFLSSAGWWQNVSGQIETLGVSGLHPGPGIYWWPNRKRQKFKLAAVSNGSSHPHICSYFGEAAEIKPTSSVRNHHSTHISQVLKSSCESNNKYCTSLSSCKQDFVKVRGLEITIVLELPIRLKIADFLADFLLGIKNGSWKLFLTSWNII